MSSFCSIFIWPLNSFANIRKEGRERKRGRQSGRKREGKKEKEEKKRERRRKEGRKENICTIMWKASLKNNIYHISNQE